MLLIMLALYFAPAIVAHSRKHRQSLAIAVLNLFLGWTILGWVIALVWAVMNPAPVAAPIASTSDQQPGPAAPAGVPPELTMAERVREAFPPVQVGDTKISPWAIAGLFGLVGLAIFMVAELPRFYSPEEREPAIETPPAYLAAAAAQQSFCQTATAVIRQRYSGADRIALNADQPIQVTTGAGGWVLTCPVKIGKDRGWANVTAQCESATSATCVDPYHVSVGGKPLKAANAPLAAQGR